MARNFKSFIEGYLEYNKNNLAPPEYILWSAFSMMAGAIGRKVWCATNFVYTYPNLYVFIVGDKGVGKSTNTNISMNILKELPEKDRCVVMSNKINDAVLVKKLSIIGNEKHFKFNGQTYQDSSSFIYASEASNTFKEMYPGSSIIDSLTDLYNCNDDPWLHTSSWSKETKGEGVTAVYNPCINLLACTTPQWLMTKVLSKDAILGGFGSRIIMVVHEGSWSYANSDKGVDQNTTLLRQKVVDDLKHISQLKGPFTIHKDFIEAQSQYENSHNILLNNMAFTDRMLAAFLARKGNAFITKISMLLAIAESDELELRAEHAHKAWELLTDLEKTLPYAFATFGESQEVKHTMEIWRYIKYKKLEHVSFKDLCVVFAKDFSTETVRRAISDLKMQDKLVIDSSVDKRVGDTIFKVIELDEQPLKLPQ